MLIRCPHCGHRIDIRNAKPQRYHPTCDKCRRKFILLVKGEPGPDQKMAVFRDEPELIARVQQIKTAPDQPTATTPAGAALPPHSLSDEPIEAVIADPGNDNLAEINLPDDVRKPATAADVQRTLVSEKPSPAPARPASPTADDDDPPMRVQRPDVPRPSGRQFERITSSPAGSGVGDVTLPGQPATPASVTDSLELPTRAERSSPPRAAAADLTLPTGGSAADGIPGYQPPRRTHDSATPDMDRTAPPPTSTASRAPDTDQTVISPLTSGAADMDITLVHDDDDADPNATVASRFDSDRTVASAADGAQRLETSAGGGELRGNLGGYHIERLLGRGGMGSVYLARQLSLDRPVALKTMNPQWAQDPIFLSRFTREAFAAAQLVHHHVVQIYDISEEKKTHFFSMEFVTGRSLQGVLEQKGRLDVEEAVGYILQAARGLKFAHDHGMVHRDIKPDNLMLNEQGIVKVADLGLVKTPDADVAERQREQELDRSGKDRPPLPPSGSRLAASAHVTMAGAAMGTPAYMAPEQASDAASVDHRADIYSLGCTLYTLVTGQPVFTGKTIMEVMTKHATEPVTPPDVVAERVPKSLSSIVMKMVAKRPSDRYQSMDEVIAALELFLGVSSAGPFTPQEQHATLLESSARSFNKSRKAALRRLLKVAFVLLCVLAFVGLALSKQFVAAGGVVGLAVLTGLAYFAVTGIFDKTYVFRRFRQFVLGSRLADWLMMLLGAAGAAAVLYVFNLLWVWLGLCVLAVVLALGFYFVIDKLVARDRAAAVQDVQDMLKTMRLRGLEEEALRRFVCRYSGANWEAFYEALFGYEAKLAARGKWGQGDDGKPRKRYGIWRDFVTAWIDEKQRARDEAAQRRHLQKIERAKLQAQGMNELQARKEAQWAAVSMVASAAKFQETVKLVQAAPEGAALPAGVTGKVNVNQMIYGDENEQGVRDTSGPGLPARLLNLLLGARMRFALAVILLGACALWMHQNGLIPQQVSSKEVSLDSLKQLQLTQADDAKPLELPLLPAPVLTVLSGYGVGLAGLVLLLSCLFRGKKMTVFMLPAAGVILVGHLIPGFSAQKLGPLQGQHLIWAVGGAIAVVGLLFGRRRQ